MSKWEDNKWKMFWSWVVLATFAVVISFLYRSERTKRVELERQHSELKIDAVSMAELLDFCAAQRGVSFGVAELVKLKYGVPDSLLAVPPKDPSEVKE